MLCANLIVEQQRRESIFAFMHALPALLRLNQAPLPPSTMIAVDLHGASLPSPELKKSFKFPGAPRGVVPPNQILPQIIGVEHDPEGLRIANAFISSLPKGAKVGIEYDRWQLFEPRTRNILAENSSTFSGIAAAAHGRGHPVVLLERRSFHIPSKHIELVRLMKQTANKVLVYHDRPDRIEDIRERLDSIAQGFGVPRGCSICNAIRTSAWRSELMARTIARLGDWTAEDVILVGTAHALNLAKIFDVKISTVIGHYSSQLHMESRLQEVMERQTSSHAVLTRHRERHKTVFALTHPTQARQNKRYQSS